MPRLYSEITELEIREGLEGLNPARILTLYRRAPLTHPVSAADQVWHMYEQASLVLSAWHEERLVGIARVMTDGILYSFLCDLAVEPDVQGLGIGRRLAEAIFDRCAGTQLILIGTGNTAGMNSLYARFGFTRLNDVWIREL